ncbi:MAG: hypothetical protein MJZ07_01470 [Bacteroidales bacterium]|nr:hypothetical protein [Bacteroidales bacterium]
MDPFKGTHKGLVSMSGKIIFDLAYYEIYALPNDEYVGIVFPRWDDSKVFVDVYCGNYKKKKETIVFDLASLESYYMTSQCEYPIFETWIINDYYGNTVTGLFLKGLYHATRLEFVSACDYFKHVMSMTKGSPADSLGSELYSVSEKNIKAIRKYCIEH